MKKTNFINAVIITLLVVGCTARKQPVIKTGEKNNRQQFFEQAGKWNDAGLAKTDSLEQIILERKKF